MSFSFDSKHFGDCGSVPVHIYKSGPFTQFQLAHQLVRQGKSVVLTLNTASDVKIYAQLVATLLPPDDFARKNTFFLPGYFPDDNHVQAWNERWEALYFLHERSAPSVLVASLENFVLTWPHPQEAGLSFLRLRVGEEYLLESIVEFLVENGYSRVSTVTRPGEFSSRGDLLDVFSLGYGYPVRIDFFGEQIESLRLFEPLSQRSRKDVGEVVLAPVSSKGAVAAAETSACWQRWTKLGELGPSAMNFLEAQREKQLSALLPAMWGRKRATLFDWLDKDAVFFCVHARDMRSRLDEAFFRWQGFLQEIDKRWPWQDLLVSPAEIRKAISSRQQLLFDDLVLGEAAQGVELFEQEYGTFEQLFWEPAKRERPARALIDELRQRKKTWNQTILGFRSRQSRRKFLDFAAQENLSFFDEYQPEKKGLFALVGEVGVGMVCGWNKTAFFPEHILQPGKSAVKQKKGVFAGLRSFDGLEAGDLLVHREYGLCRFGGLQRLKVGDVPNDYLLLLFARDDRLYLPVDRLNLVQRYKGPDGSSPPLDKLGGTSWTAARSRVRKAIEKIAHDLVAMYAYRKVAKGFTYDSLPVAYQEFELGFDFDETPDQEKAIAAVLADMERPEPMDRLVCGDVGFGKTEVAMRAAFRAAIAGRQVVILCPTTILAEQHYQNFRARMEPFSIHVAMLSRFVPAARQKEILQATAKGNVQVLIGTHRLLSGDVQLPNLGLLILDEEQRFGVKHKERLKRLRQDVDVLALTATPIPRTLQLSLSGIRSLSVIETPPVDRLPVQTALMERNMSELKAVLERELERKGQVFWVYNRISGLERILEDVRQIVPQARIGMAHGKMSAATLEKTMHAFWHGELDILVSTAIVESGIDFPRANTLIVDQAQLFGLGQLYQLRGRVGRSETQGYAYFIVPNLDSISEQVKKRMQIILNLDFLGAGFQVALEDLRLRGAGNLLGEVQSGNIGKVGLDLFLEMLEEEVARIKGEPTKQRLEPEMNIKVPAYIPESYVLDSAMRLQYYKELSSCKKSEDLQNLEEEMADRFGPFPLEMETFFGVLRLKIVLTNLGAVRADLLPDRLIAIWVEGENSLDIDALLAWIGVRECARLLPPAKLEVRFKEDASLVEALSGLASELGQLVLL